MQLNATHGVRVSLAKGPQLSPSLHGAYRLAAGYGRKISTTKSSTALCSARPMLAWHTTRRNWAVSHSFPHETRICELSWRGHQRAQTDPLPRFPAPERREARTMPAKDGLRLNDVRRTEQARPAPGHPHQQGPVTAAQSKTRRRTPRSDAELMAEEQVLGFKSARRLEEIDNEHCERMQEREHRSRSCADSTRRCDSQAGWNFRKGHRSNRGNTDEVGSCWMITQ
jgi:hypothetical protein